MGSLPQESSYSPTSHHQRMLQQVTGEIDAASSLLIRSYKRSFNGFAAKLTEEQREKIAQMEEVASVFPSTTLHTQTTRSWDFMGLVEKTKRNVSAESDVIIGFLDTGIWPESESFTDKGFGPPPKKWRGTCAGGKNFTCNNKVIGARFYKEDSARDNAGHGSHTASTAAGNNVNGASFYGIAEGTARGGVPSARIAVYKTCDSQGFCNTAGILAAFDDAIADGVDILSVSIGGMFAPDNLYDDSITIGSFHAMAKGILTVQSAGNGGPYSEEVISVAPWILTVAASHTDRQIVDKLVLGNGTTLVGDSVNAFDPKGTKYPIAKCVDRNYSDLCVCLKSEIQGKIVLCGAQIDLNVHEAGAVGAIGRGSTQSLLAPPDVSVFPYLTLSENDYDVVESYSRSSANPEAGIMKSESIVDNTAPRVAEFSSRGPNIAVPEILKPDITAPGVHILAAYSPLAPPSGNDEFDLRRGIKYSIMSGTSMSCPHASGIAAYVKSFHPDWSPAAIKSAIMTTAKPMNIPTNDDDHVDDFAYGSGHVNPVRAIDPGLVYDISKQEYLELLCNLGYNTSIIKKISGDHKVTCPKSPDRSLIRNTNFPSMLAEVKSMKPFDVKINRTVTNVGFVYSKYEVTVRSTQGVNITVEPKVLSFQSSREKQSFVVRIVGGKLPAETVVSSSLVWSDGTHNVRSPIIVNVLNSTRG
ncbi:subtilisin-like protease SBT4.6 [Neltuma alba]|uniref:subtilisin-like protease SBT4.6 n=1 Tax=Neltuma alba TaxID=207710 RepID=UPI0010A408D6|nr:subtilisin-like protease SBT4.6 [Prosopis alba]